MIRRTALAWMRSCHVDVKRQYTGRVSVRLLLIPILDNSIYRTSRAEWSKAWITGWTQKLGRTNQQSFQVTKHYLWSNREVSQVMWIVQWSHVTWFYISYVLKPCYNCHFISPSPTREYARALRFKDKRYCTHPYLGVVLSLSVRLLGAVMYSNQVPKH